MRLFAGRKQTLKVENLRLEETNRPEQRSLKYLSAKPRAYETVHVTQRKPSSEKWDSFIERQIREAQEAGEFDHLPGFGKPLAEIDDPYDEHWWLRKKVRQEKLSITPPALQIRLDVEKTRQAILKLPDEAAVREAIEALNERIRRANFAAIWGPPLTTVPLDVEAVVSQWRAARDAAIDEEPKA